MHLSPPRSGPWLTALETIGDTRPGADPALFAAVARELDGFHARGPLDRRECAFRILDLLSRWAREWEGKGSPFERMLLQVWHPLQSWLQIEVVDLLSPEAAVVTSLPSPRFVTAQGLGATVAVFLFHRRSWGLGAALLAPRCDSPAAVWSLVHELERRLPEGWVAEEIDAWIAGGRAREDATRLADVRAALTEARLRPEAVHGELSERRPDDGPLHVAFDRVEGRARAFHPGFDPVHYNMRARLERERCRVESTRPTPSLIWPFQK